jgi:hypothetical protein
MAIANAKLALDETFTPQIKSMLAKRLRAEAMEATEGAEKAKEEPFQDADAVGGNTPVDTSGIGAGDNKEPSDAANDSSDIDQGGEAETDSSTDWYDDWSESDFDLDEVIKELENDVKALSEAEEEEEELDEAEHEGDEEKEEKLLAFLSGEARALVTKPMCAGFGLNMQHCAHMTFFPSHSYEQYYQSIRRCWRFGQKRPVTVHQIGTTSLSNVAHSRQRKAAAADTMFQEMMRHMIEAQKHRPIFKEVNQVQLPSWV